MKSAQFFRDLADGIDNQNHAAEQLQEMISSAMAQGAAPHVDDCERCHLSGMYQTGGESGALTDRFCDCWAGREAKKDRDISNLTRLLSTAVCPDCDGSGEAGDYQCQWCYERDHALADPGSLVEKLKLPRYAISVMGNGKLWIQHGDGEGMECAMALFETEVAEFFRKYF